LEHQALHRAAPETGWPMAHVTEMNTRLQAELLRQVLRVLPGNALMSLALLATAVAALWTYVEHNAVLEWAGIAVGVAAARLTIHRAYRNAQAVDLRVLRLATRQRLGCLAAGVAWSLATVFLWQPQELVPQLLLLVTLCGVTAGAATSLAADLPSALLFQAPIFVALLARLWSDDRLVSRGVGAMVFAYGLFTVVTVRRLHSNVKENVVLHLEALEREARLQESEARYRQQAERDALTGLGNRFALQSTLSRQLSAAAAADWQVAVLYIDLDNFKDINDTRGHRCGDHLLQAVAERLCARVAPGDAVYRVGGDEFIVIANSGVDRRRVERLAQSLLEALAVPVDLDDGAINCSASIGIGMFPDDGADVDVLLKHADVALYQAKDGGRDGYTFYASGQSQRITERLDLERSLAEAISQEQIYLEYQPLIDLESGTITGVEALARWRHPDRGLISPAVFIPVAERCGYIEALGELVLRLLCRQMRLWESQLLPSIAVALNVSPQQLDLGLFTRCFVAMTREFHVDPARFEIEVTESALIDQRQGHMQALQQLQQLGARVSIDDFGTGYSSLSYLKHLPIDSVKIDRCFVHDMLNDSRDAAIVAAIVTLGHSLGLRVVAEGVESAEQVLKLKSLGCDVVQGYFYHRPVSGEQFAALLMADSQRVNAVDEPADTARQLRQVGS
jgi:diguanylate cyclase (GGDEF)-like protein